MKPCLICKDTGKQRVLMGGPDGTPVDHQCFCRKGPLAPEEALDGIVFRMLTAQQLVDRIAADFTVGDRVTYPDRDRVLRYIGRLVEVYGSKLGGLTRAKLASKVMRRLEARQRKQANADWAKYYGKA